ncbi:hypothetical protein B0H14DRAFT_2890739, partial [Mycena olivaceomarginata]
MSSQQSPQALPADRPSPLDLCPQSSGKSSVLRRKLAIYNHSQNNVGGDFLPSGSGIVTRRPLLAAAARWQLLSAALNGLAVPGPSPLDNPYQPPVPLTLEQQHITAVEGIVFLVQNTVAIVNLDCRLALKTITRNAEYNPT